MASVLIVDDEPSVAHVLSDVLRDAGYRVVIAYDGANALGAYERQNTDAVVADFLLPNIDGGALFRALQQLSTPPLCCVLMSELDVAYLKRVCPTCDAYLQKPFSIEDLTSTLLDCLASRISSPHP